jgi:anthranilate phosphoribosyltransferase
MAETMTWPELLSGLVRGEDQPAEATAWAMGKILNGDATPAQLAAFVIGLRSKGETVEELTGLADMMIEFATPIEIGGPAVDVVGSGGDRSNTVNISTMAAIVAAAAGARVVKHGNRAASSACGAADVLEALGLVLDLAPKAQQQVVDQVGDGSSVFLRRSTSSDPWPIRRSLYHRRSGLPIRAWLSSWPVFSRPAVTTVLWFMAATGSMR